MLRRLAACAALLAAVACSSEKLKQQYFENGERLLERGQAADAVVELRNAVREDGLWGEARFKLAEAYEATGEYEAAYREYQRAADLMPDNAAAQLKAVTYLLLVGQYEDAKTRARRVIDADPKNIDAHIAYGNALAGLRDLDGAITQLTEAMQLDPSRSQAHGSVALVHVAKGDPAAAKAEFEKAVQTDERSVPARLALANFQWSQGDMKAVEQSLMRAREIDPTNELTNRALSTYYMETARPAQAEQYLRALSDAAKTPDAKLALADYYVAYDREADARRVLEPLKGTPVSAAAETRLADLTYASGDHQTAHQMLDDLLKRQPNLAIGQVLAAQWLILENKPERALERAKLAVAASPRYVVALYTRGVAEARTRRIQDALNTFSDVLRRNPRAADAQVQLSALHLSRNDAESARQFAEEAVQNAPSRVDARAALVRALIAGGDVVRAQTELDGLRRMAADTSVEHELRGLLQARANNRAAAKRSFERALDIDPDNFSALVGLVRLALVSGDLAAAKPRVEERLRKDPDNPPLLLMAARLSLAGGDAAGAETLLRRSIVIDPVDTSNFALLAQIYIDGRRVDPARQEFDAIAGRETGNVSARAMAAVLVHAQGDIAGAAKRYEDVLKADPRITVAANNLASIYADAGENLDVAQRLAETAVAQLPSNADVIDTLGWVYHRRQMYGKAVTQFEQSVATGPDKADYHYHLGLAYTKTGDRVRAREALQTAIKLNPRYKEARDALSQLGPAS